MSISILSGVIDLVSNGVKHVFDHKNTKIKAELEQHGISLKEKELETLMHLTEIKFKEYVLKNSLEIDNNFRDFVVQYEGAAKDVSPAVQFIRAIIRPFISIWAVGLISYLMFANPAHISLVAQNMEAIPDKLWDIFFIVFAFWFGGRAVQHIIEKYSTGRVSQARETARGKVDEAKLVTKSEQKVEQERTKQISIHQQSIAEEEPIDRFTKSEEDEAFGRQKKRIFRHGKWMTRTR